MVTREELSKKSDRISELYDKIQEIEKERERLRKEMDAGWQEIYRATWKRDLAIKIIDCVANFEEVKDSGEISQEIRDDATDDKISLLIEYLKEKGFRLSEGEEKQAIYFDIYSRREGVQRKFKVTIEDYEGI